MGEIKDTELSSRFKSQRLCHKGAKTQILTKCVNIYLCFFRDFEA